MKPRRAFALLVALVILAAFALGPGRALIPRLGGIPVPSGVVQTAAHGPTGLLVRLNVGYDQGPEDGFGRHTADYLSDGTVIRWINRGAACEPGRSCGTLERNTLSATGMAVLRALLARDAELLAEPGKIRPQVLLDKSTTGRANEINTFVLERPDGTRYTVSAPSSKSPDADVWAPDPAIERLDALAEALADPTTLVGVDGLANPTWVPYQPTKMAAFISISEAPSQAAPTPYRESNGTMVVPLDGRYKYPEIGWPFEGTPDTFGTAFKGPYNMARCAFLPSADAMTAIASLPEVVASDVAGGYLASGSDWTSGSGIWRDKVLSLTVVGLLPEDVTRSCADALSQ